MPRFDSIKNTLFPDKKSQDLLVRSVAGSQDFDQAFNGLFFEIKEPDLQKILAPILREITIKYMRNSHAVYASAFRETYKVISDDELVETSTLTSAQRKLESEKRLTAYLDNQGRNGVWGTEVEAGALADLLDMSVMVTPVNDGIPQTSLKPRESSDPAAAIVHLYNANNVHWYIYEDESNETLGDNNCLYNAFAQSLRHTILHECARESFAPWVKLGIPDAHRRAYLAQAELLKKIQGLPPIPIDQLLKNAISVVQKKEAEDHAVALVVAIEDGEKEDKQCRILIDFDRKLNELAQHIEQLQGNQRMKQSVHANEAERVKLDDTIRAAVAIHTELTTYRNEYKEHPQHMNAFVSNCKLAINQERKNTIGTHLVKWSFNHILDEILRYLDLISYFTGNRFFKIKTTTEQKVNAIESTLDGFTVL